MLYFINKINNIFELNWSLYRLLTIKRESNLYSFGSFGNLREK